MGTIRLSIPGLPVLVFASLLASAGVDAADAPPSVAAFAAEVDYGEPALSPDGRKVVLVVHNQQGRVLVVLDLESKEIHGLMPATVDNFEIRHCHFKSDVRVLCGFLGTNFGADSHTR